MLCCGIPRNISWRRPVKLSTSLCMSRMFSLDRLLIPWIRIVSPSQVMLGKAAPQTHFLTAEAQGALVHELCTFQGLSEQSWWNKKLGGLFYGQPSLPGQQRFRTSHARGSCGVDALPGAWVGFATLSLVQDRSTALLPRPNQDLLPLFLIPTFLLCSQYHGAPGSKALCRALSCKRGPWTQLPKRPVMRNVHLFLKKQQEVGSLEWLVSSCLQLSTNTTEISSVSKTCLFYHLHPLSVSGGRKPHEISLPNRFFFFSVLKETKKTNA